MKHIILSFFVAAVALLIVSCEQPQPEPAQKVTVSASPTSASFGKDGGTTTLSITSNGVWYARTDASWLKVTPTSGSGNGSVTVTATANTGDARTGSVILETADSKVTVSVSQEMFVKADPVTKTIREILALYPGKDYKITEDLLVEGMVISDYRRNTDGGLNNYSSAKTIIISDGDAGLMLYCDGDNKTFARGHKVRVHLKDQTLSVYQEGAIQVKDLSLSNVVYLGEGTPVAKEITVDQLLTGDFESMYVAVKDVQIRQEYLNQPFYNATNKGTIGFEGKSGGKFDLFTSQYSVFKDDIVPTGSGTLKGIAGKYQSRIQVTISEKNDFAGLTGARYDTGSYFSLPKTEASVSGDAGSFSLLVSGNVAWTATSSDPAFTVTPASGTTGGTVSISYTDNPSSTDSRQAVITFTTDNAAIAEKSLQFTVTQQPFEALVQSEVRPWMELPAVQAEEGKAFFSHDMIYEGQTVRNYSFWYDLGNRVSLWVAYPLYKGMTSGVKRTDKWAYDPIVPRRYQGDVTSSYAGYDRGHQIPSADRLCNVAANEQTFYFTNITPQNPNLNQGIWETLEAQIRGQVSSCDTLYVVTGCVLTTDDDPAIVYVKDTQGRDVAVPKAYYKVILRYKAGEANGGYSAIGFWLENRSYGSEVIKRGYAYSVDDIEKRVGIDFFVNLKDEYEKEAEARYDPATWGL